MPTSHHTVPNHKFTPPFSIFHPPLSQCTDERLLTWQSIDAGFTHSQYSHSLSTHLLTWQSIDAGFEHFGHATTATTTTAAAAAITAAVAYKWIEQGISGYFIRGHIKLVKRILSEKCWWYSSSDIIVCNIHTQKTLPDSGREVPFQSIEQEVSQ